MPNLLFSCLVGCVDCFSGGLLLSSFEVFVDAIQKIMGHYSKVLVVSIENLKLDHASFLQRIEHFLGITGYDERHMNIAKAHLNKMDMGNASRSFDPLVCFAHDQELNKLILSVMHRLEVTAGYSLGFDYGST
jgi:hypothetical protein